MNNTRSMRRAGSTFLVLSIAAVLVCLMLAALVLRGGEADSEGALDEFVVDRGSFEITVPASGELAAARQIEIRNKLELRAVITEIVEEGSYVGEGDVLVRFAADELEDKIQDARDVQREAENAKIAAEANLEIRESERDSAIDKAELDVELAQLALKAWEEGEVVAKRKDLELELETAQKDFDRLWVKFEESRDLVEKSFISADEYRTDEINMIKAKARLEQAQLAAEVYEKYEHKQQKAQKESDVEQAMAELERVKKRHKAEIDRAQYDVEAKVANLRSRNERLEDFVKQLDLCTLRAPQDGLVVYSQSLEEHRWGRGDRGDLQVGAEVRKNELLMVLPDVSQMTAEVKVNESLTGLIEEGQRVIVTSDAVPDAGLEGEVQSIAVLAESGGWRDPNRRDYTVTVLLTNGNDIGLKPSMRCKAEIYVREVQDAVYVPLQAVFREGSTAYVYVADSRGFAERAVRTGESSGMYVEITNGLEPGESVLLREPDTREIVARLDDNQTPQGQASLARPANFARN